MLGSETKANGAKYFMQAPALVLAFTRALLLHPSCRTAAAAPAKEHQHPAPPQPDALARAAVVMINSAVTSSALPCSCTTLPSTLLGHSAAGFMRTSVAAGAAPSLELMALMSSCTHCASSDMLRTRAPQPTSSTTTLYAPARHAT
jgi:hypothetical protein